MQQISFKSVQRFYQNSISMCHLSLNSWHHSWLSAKALYFPTHSMIMSSIKFWFYIAKLHSRLQETLYWESRRLILTTSCSFMCIRI